MKLPHRNLPRLAALAATSLGVVCALAAAFGAPQARAQTGNAQTWNAQTWQEIRESEDWMHDVTVLTMAPDGAWGTATEPFVNDAIANAIARCKAMSGAELGCGAYFTSIRAGWSLGIRCGRENIIVTERDLVAAEQRALRRESELRTEYLRDLPDCVRVVTVDPSGRIVPPRPRLEGTADVTASR